MSRLRKRIGITWKWEPSPCLVSKSLDYYSKARYILQIWLIAKPTAQYPSSPSTCILLLTWATVVRVSIHTFQEGYSRQGWFPTAAFGGCQTTAYRAGKERGARWDISMTNICSPSLTKVELQNLLGRMILPPEHTLTHQKKFPWSFEDKFHPYVEGRRCLLHDTSI